VKGNEITPEMIVRAREYKLENLIEFDAKGVAKCFNHEEKTGSLHLNKKQNTARCFGSCQKTFNPLHVLTKRDGMSFPDAVRKLTNGI